MEIRKRQKTHNWVSFIAYFTALVSPVCAPSLVVQFIFLFDVCYSVLLLLLLFRLQSFWFACITIQPNLHAMAYLEAAILGSTSKKGIEQATVFYQPNTSTYWWIFAFLILLLFGSITQFEARFFFHLRIFHFISARKPIHLIRKANSKNESYFDHHERLYSRRVDYFGYKRDMISRP